VAAVRHEVEMKVNFETHPSKYRHWLLEIVDDVAKLTLKTTEDGGLKPGYKLKLNSYDLAVDIELADAIERIRFEHPQVSMVTITGGIDKMFCAGANIHMLSQSGHSFKVNFCKFTNETRLGMEDASKYSGIRFLCAANGIAAGGGYELALACDKILLVDDGNSAVSLPEVPLLGVLPGTGGLTRLVDKRKVRKDLADAFCTIAEGAKAKKALEWDLVDAIASQRDFAQKVTSLENEMKGPSRGKQGVKLEPLNPNFSDHTINYRYVTLELKSEKRICEMTIAAPSKEQPTQPDEMVKWGDELWALRAFREISDAILQLRLNYSEIALIVFKTTGDAKKILDFEQALATNLKSDVPHWYATELLSLMRRAFKRIDVTSKSMTAVVDGDSCYAGSLAELLFCADQSFMMEAGSQVQLGAFNRGLLPMGNGLSRLEQRFSGQKDKVEAAQGASMDGPLDAAMCQKLGLVTHALDEIDFDEELRLFCEERASLSPDALTGMEASLRFSGPETLETKIFSRLSAWQNWIFIRDNATGEKGALTNYGKPTRPQFDFERC
jgi:benzoyl-CoA-dihydrodiol lyase